MGEHCDLYLTTDVLLIADALERLEISTYKILWIRSLLLFH